MARISPLTLPEFHPDIFAESVGSGTDHLVPGGLPLDVTTVPLVNGKRLLQAGSIVNRAAIIDPTLPLPPYKYWNNASVEPLEDFLMVAFTIDDVSGVEKKSNADPGCNGVRPNTLIYEDRLPSYWAALTASKKTQIRQKYHMIFSRKVAV